MTVNELERQVAHLGFESALEDREAFITAAASALALIYTDRPSTESARMCTRPITPTTRVEKIDLKGGEEVTLHLYGSSYAFRVSGKGNATVKSKIQEDSYTFNSDFSVIRGSLPGEGTLTLFGDFTFSVYDLVAYAECYENSSEIPLFEERCTYDIAALYPLFTAFVSLPTDVSGREIQAARMEGGRLTLPENFKGAFTVSFRTSPPSREELYAGEEIRMPSECSELLPLLTAAFLWLDDDPDKAHYYMSLYKDSLATLRRFTPKHIDNKYETADGWA